MEKQPDWKRIEEVCRDLVRVLHDELGWFDEESLQNTPGRIARFYKEWTDNYDFKFTMFEVPTEHTKSMVILKDIDFYSMCSHHMLPFFGKAHIAYLPREGGKICGVSKLARTVKKFASKPQVQEVLTNEIADFLFEQLDPWFVMVVLEAQHLCMLMRGVKQHESKMLTSAVRWDKSKFDTKDLGHLKEEVLRLVMR